MVQAVTRSSKSGLKKFNAREVLFHENEIAESLYIIQRGQIRLYIPKGRGFVEIAILRAGEVIGEMAYFDEKSRKRSCSAAAIVTTEVVEISFNAFDKAITGLNPWFKTIINTLADRLRATNTKVKQLESNSVGFGKDGKVADYKFFTNTDVIRVVTLIYMVLKSNGEVREGATYLDLSKLKFYCIDIFGIPEIKYEEFVQMLKEEHFVELLEDDRGLGNTMRVRNVDVFRRLMVFFNTQKYTADDKKLHISTKCERFLGAMMGQLKDSEIKKGIGIVDVSKILGEFRSRNVPIFEEDLSDAVVAGFCDDIVVGDGKRLSVKVEYDKLTKSFPSIKMMNIITRINEEKSESSNY